ncbi:MAG: peroxiredoxin [Desulfovibrio sp.]|nr:MAG: peroxiredoxin [Desulfovibrio sp.]
MEAKFPLIGDQFPEMEVRTTQGMLNLPKDMAGKWFVVFSHPADYTPVCTTEFVAFQKRMDEFRALNCELVGLSIDQVFSHIKWIDWIKEKMDVEIEFPVIADDMGRVAQSLGMIHPGKGTNTVRAVFIVDDKGFVRIIFYYPQELGRNIDEILRAVKGMQTSDANGVAIPAGWPNNELIGEGVIVPPALDVETAKKRPSEYDCFDWWFCHKKI